MASRKRRPVPRRRYRTRLHELVARHTRFARSVTPEPTPTSPRDSQSFQAPTVLLEDHGLPLISAGEEIAEQLPDVDEILAGEISDDSR